MYGKEAPCDTCQPHIDERNQRAAQVYAIVKDQLRMGSNGPIAVDQGAVLSVIDLLKIKDPTRVFFKVLTMMERHLELIAERYDGE